MPQQVKQHYDENRPVLVVQPGNDVFFNIRVFAASNILSIFTETKSTKKIVKKLQIEDIKK